MSDESLELAQVQAAFREAEKKFQDLARAAQDLESSFGAAWRRQGGCNSRRDAPR